MFPRHMPDKMVAMEAWFDREFFDVLRKERGVGWGAQLVVMDRTTSTNDDALGAVATGVKSGAVWIARSQAKGRGRRGNTWASPPGDNLLCSVLFRYPGDPSRFMGLSLVVGLAIVEVVGRRLSEDSSLCLNVEVKWPNDVMVEGKKIAGVLVETRSGQRGDLSAVIGVGLNLRTKEFSGGMADATSLLSLGANEAGCRLEMVLADLLGALQTKLETFIRDGLAPFVAELDAADYLKGKRISVGSVEGRACGLDAQGQLLVRTEDGTTKPVLSGSVELKSS